MHYAFQLATSGLRSAHVPTKVVYFMTGGRSSDKQLMFAEQDAVKRQIAAQLGLSYEEYLLFEYSSSSNDRKFLDITAHLLNRFKQHSTTPLAAKFHEVMARTLSFRMSSPTDSISEKNRLFSFDVLQATPPPETVCPCGHHQERFSYHIRILYGRVKLGKMAGGWSCSAKNGIVNCVCNCP
jgi:hypothetical protein